MFMAEELRSYTYQLFPKVTDAAMNMAPIHKNYFNNLKDKLTNASNLGRGFSESAAMAIIPKGSRGGIRNQEKLHFEAVKRAQLVNKTMHFLTPTTESFPHS